MSPTLFLGLLGLGILMAAIVPGVMQRFGVPMLVSLPIACLAGGLLVGGLFSGIPLIDPIGNASIIARVTELAVILSLTGGGLKLDRPLGPGSWGSTWRLLAIAMPLCIAALAFCGWALMGLPVAAALMLGAVMAPTDPVLASSVQVGPPGQTEEEEARFALTSEAGLNDGLAFPFVYLAMAAAAAMQAQTGSAGDSGHFDAHVLLHWFLFDVLWRIGAGLMMGWLVGRFLGRLVFRLSGKREMDEAFFAVGLTLFAYSATETIHGYGFVAVFIAALTFRRVERDHEFHGTLHHFVEQAEVIFVIYLIFLTGIAISQGVLAPIGPGGIAVALIFLLVVRPVTGWIALSGAKMSSLERFAIAVLGIRGVGSFYYLAFALARAPFSVETGRRLWAVGVLIVALSVVLHGLGAPKVMEALAHRRRRRRAGRPQQAGGPTA